VLNTPQIIIKEPINTMNFFSLLVLKLIANIMLGFIIAGIYNGSTAIFGSQYDYGKEYVTIYGLKKFFIVADFLVLCYLWDLIKSKVKKISNPSLFFFETTASKSVKEREIEQYMSVLKKNLKRTTDIFKYVYLRKNFDITELEKERNDKLEEVRKDLTNKVNNFECVTYTRNIRKDINSFSNDICDSVNRILISKKIDTRYYFEKYSNDDEKTPNGSFVPVKFEVIKIKDSKYEFYKLTKYSNKKTKANQKYNSFLVESDIFNSAFNKHIIESIDLDVPIENDILYVNTQDPANYLIIPYDASSVDITEHMNQTRIELLLRDAIKKYYGIDDDKEDNDDVNEDDDGKNSDKEGSDKEGSDKEGSDKEGSDKEGSDKEGSDKEGSDEEESDKEGSDEEESDEEESDEEESDEEESDEEESDEEESDKEESDKEENDDGTNKDDDKSKDEETKKDDDKSKDEETKKDDDESKDEETSEDEESNEDKGEEYYKNKTKKYRNKFRAMIKEMQARDIPIPDEYKNHVTSFEDFDGTK
jgi:hypothetical protein